MIADVPDTVADLIADAWMFLSPLAEQRWQRLPFLSRHPDKCIAMRLAILGDGFLFYPDIYECPSCQGLSCPRPSYLWPSCLCHLSSFIPLQRTETTCARESKVFQEIVLPAI